MKLTKTKLKIIRSPWYKKLLDKPGAIPDFQQELADKTKVDKGNLCSVLNERIINKSVQEKVSDEVNISVGKLFGDLAWFRAGLKKAKDIHDQQLAACSN